MNRCLAFLLAVMLATLSIASASTAQAPGWIEFTLRPHASDPSRIRASFEDDSRGRGDNNWSTSFPAPQLIGLDVASFRGAGFRPVRFALVREAGRLDCAGNGGASRATGTCAFTANAAFLKALESRGIRRPTSEQQFGLMAVDVRRELIDAVAAARYPTPDVDELMAMTAVGVTGPYIQGLAQAGYRPASIDTLVEFRALNITPDYIGGFVRAGRAGMDPDHLVTFRAMNITPEFIAGFERIGYRNLSPETLVELKALNITPEFVRSVQPDRSSVMPVNDLVRRKIFGSRQ
jgi:hypothetical protein